MILIYAILAITVLWTFWLSCDKECPSCGGKTNKAGNDYHCPKCRKLWHMNGWGILKERKEDKMKIKIEIDSSQLTDYTSISEGQELADEFIGNASDDKIISEALSRQLVEEIVDGLTPMERDKLFDLYGYKKYE